MALQVTALSHRPQRHVIDAAAASSRAGADPTKLIEDLAKRKKIKTLGVSMGQGQEVIARRHVATAAAEGCWVLLQNAHLGLGYLAEVGGRRGAARERLRCLRTPGITISYFHCVAAAPSTNHSRCTPSTNHSRCTALHCCLLQVEQLLSKAETLHDSFRLWVTAEPHPAFPIGLLQASIKVTNEAPVGIKAGLRASYQWVTQETLDAVNRWGGGAAAARRHL